jgi:chemotaxis protein methyltransferase CheR
MRITELEFDYVRRLVYDRAAIVLEPGKAYLVESRLEPVAREAGLGSLRELIRRLQTEQQHALHVRVVEAMTTNETSFFRDTHPFEALRQTLLPELIARRAAERRLHLWCAACSSGQEPYSLAILLREHFPQLATWSLRFIASDISREMLARSSEGCYSQLEVNRGLPASLLAKYFQRQGLQWQVKEEIRRMVEFREINLSQRFPTLPLMDLVLMRNVLIYFDVDTKKAILGKVRALLRPDGYLILGHAETTVNLDAAYERVRLDQISCYRLRAN